MRATAPFLARVSLPTLATLAALATLATLAVTGCATKPKQADDPTNESTHNKTPPEEMTKWEPAAPPPEPKPKGSGTSSVNEGATRRSDQYDKEATEVVVKRAARQVKENCGAAKDENGKAVGPWGKATLQLQLGSNGHSKGVTVPAPYQGKPVGNCVEKAFANLTFPPWGGSDTEITWDVELVQPGAAEKK